MRIANEDIRALNATIFVHSTPNSIIGKGYFAWRSQMSSFSWFKLEFICPSVSALNATIFVHSTPNSINGKGYSSWRSQMSLLSWFKHKFICPDVRVLNATIFVHLTHKTSIGKGYCGWRLQMSYSADLRTNSYVLMLERWMLPFSYIQRPRLWFVWNIVYEDCK